MKRFLVPAALLAALLGGGATAAAGVLPGWSAPAGNALTAAGAGGTAVSDLTDTSWGGGCELPLCKPLN
ncbi:hypothetical protein [Kitasatospora sp. NBC_00315]|uniref:hypothetical protein n=1 Tax=Kitasatospora sp. NBC_00315 TaxID=2975963 RepID=UPI00324F0E50